MQKCRLNGQPVYAFEVLGKNNVVNNEYEDRLRVASEKGVLKCEECGSDIIFKFGKVKIPHFAHKYDSNGGGCSYSGETEEHIKGKQLLLNLMMRTYPDIYYEIRYRFKNGKWADLYFKFNDNEELVIEFQRRINSILKWNEKRQFYKDNNITDMWFISGKIEDFEDIVREYEFLFQHRLVINNTNNRLLILDVDKESVLIVAKIIINDDITSEVGMDYLFKKVYKLSDIKINKNGQIECDFDADFIGERDKFINEYKLEKIRQEEERIKEEREKEELKRRLEQLRIKAEEERKVREKQEEELRDRYKRQSEERRVRENANKSKVFKDNKYSNNSYKPNYNYKKDDEYYRDKVNKAIMGYRYGIENVVRILINGGSDQYYLIKRFFNEEIERGNQRAKKICDEVMRLAGLD